MTSAGTVLLLNAVLAGPGPAPDIADAGDDVVFIPAAGLLSVARRRPAAEFDPDNPLLADPAWVTPRALEHESLSRAARAAAGAVLPVPFGVVFASEAGVADFLTRNRDAAAAFLQQFGALLEWGVRLDADRAAVVDAILQQRLAAGTTLSDRPGVRYLQEQRLRRDCEAALPATLARAADSLEAHLAQSAPTARRPARAAETNLTPVAHVALVGTDPAATLAAWIAPTGFVAQVRGPFLPYSFLPPLT